MSRASFACPVLLALLLAACSVPAVQAAPDKEALPTDLDLVPRNAAAFVHVRAAEVWKTDGLADVRRMFDKAGPEAYKVFIRKFAPDLATVDRLTLVMPSAKTLNNPFPSVDPEAVSALVIVTTTKPYDRLAVIRGLGQREKAYRRHLYYFNEEMWSGLYLVDDRTFIIGSEDSLFQFLDGMLHRGAGPLEPALQEAARKHHVTIGLNPAMLAKQDGIQFAPPPLVKLLEARCAAATLDLEKGIKLNLRLDYAKADEAQAGEKALRDSLDLARQGLASPIKELEENLKKDGEDGLLSQLPESFALMLGLGGLRELDGLLKDAVIQRQGTTVQLPVTYKHLESSNTLIVSMLAITALGRRANATFSMVGSKLGGGPDPAAEHLKSLQAGFAKYEKDKGAYPAAAIYDKDGRPLLSWRVALLPYLGEETLYKEFHLNEPWDSRHNKRLLKKLPKVYQTPNTWGGLKTADLVFTGDATPFAGKKGSKKADVGDGAVLLVSGGYNHLVYWTKPADLAYTDDLPVAKLFGKYGFDNLTVLLANGRVMPLNQQTDEKLLRSMIKRTGAKNLPKEEPKVEPKQ